jgi:hypothetical protein
MRPLEPLKYLSGSMVIYYVMAACSAPAGSSASNGGGSSGGASSGSSSSGVPSGGTSSGGTSSGGISSSGGGSGGSGSGAASSSGSGGSSGSPVPDANADETQSGSRLKANYYVGSDGSKQFAYFTDALRSGEICAFANADDGTIRCMPSGAYVISTEFADSSCSVPVAETTTCAAPTYAVQTAPGTSCGYVTKVFSAGSPVTTLYASSGSTCVSVGAPPAGYTYVTVGTEIAPASFQLATIQTD